MRQSTGCHQENYAWKAPAQSCPLCTRCMQKGGEQFNNSLMIFFGQTLFGPLSRSSTHRQRGNQHAQRTPTFGLSALWQSSSCRSWVVSSTCLQDSRNLQASLHKWFHRSSTWWLLCGVCSCGLTWQRSAWASTTMTSTRCSCCSRSTSSCCQSPSSFLFSSLWLAPPPWQQRYHTGRHQDTRTSPTLCLSRAALWRKNMCRKIMKTCTCEDSWSKESSSINICTSMIREDAECIGIEI